MKKIAKYLGFDSGTLICLFSLVTLVHIFGALFFPITLDEAYYSFWAEFQDTGYFDHPPFTAWLMSPVHFWREPFAIRSLSVLLAFLSFPIYLSLLRKMGFTKKDQVLPAVLLFHFSLFGLLFGVITTPDIPLVFFWLVALHEAAAALSSPKRWLSAGFFTGLGLLGKYIMLLIGPVFLWALLKKKGALKTPWPYLGGLVCLLVFSPNIFWNYKKDWISYKFQYNRGIKHSHVVNGDFSSPLPVLSPQIFDENGKKIAQYFSEKKKPEKKAAKSKLVKSLSRFLNYFTSQLVVWGGLLFAIILALFRLKRLKSFDGFPIKEPPGQLLLASALFPLVFFGIFSLFQKVEANWPAPYLIGASILLAPLFFQSKKGLFFGAFLNTLIILTLFFHGFSPLSFANPAKDRILKETHGFKSLADYLSKFNTPIFADTYQLTSSLNFYAKNLAITQWPGLTRSSEITRRSQMTKIDFKDLENKGQFILVTTAFLPPKIPGFTVKGIEELRDCANQFEINKPEISPYDPQCSSPIHRWFASTYQKSK